MSDMLRALIRRAGPPGVLLSVALAAIVLAGDLRAAPPPEPTVITIGPGGQLDHVVIHLRKQTHDRVVWRNTQKHEYIIEFYVLADPHDATSLLKCLSYIRRRVPPGAISSAGPEGVHDSAVVGRTYKYRVIDAETGLVIFQGGDSGLHPLPTDPGLVIDG